MARIGRRAEPGVADRIWWHFAMNLLPTVAAVMTLREAWRTGLLGPASRRGDMAQPGEAEPLSA